MLKIDRVAATEVWTIDRPAARNALDSTTMEALAGAIRGVAANSDIRAVVLTGSHSTFVSGGDLKELRERVSREDAETLSDTGFEICAGIESLRIPVIAAVNGNAIGGGAELAIACDVRILDPDARLSFKQARMGVTTAWGTIERLPAIVGHGTAAHLLFTGQEVGGDEARRIGLATAISQPGKSREAALDMAAKIAGNSPSAVAEMKRLLVRGRTSNAGRAEEREAFLRTWTSAEHHEAVAAFFEKRDPSWTQ